MNAGVRIAVMGLVLGVSSALAQDRAELWRRCEGSGTNRGEMFASCTKLIESGRESEQDLAVAYYYRGLLYNWDERKKAITDQSEAIRLNPWFVDALIERGRAYTGERDYDRALRDFREVLRLEPGNARAFLYRGETYLEKRMYQEALKEFDEAIRLAINLSAAYDGRHQAYRGLGHPEPWHNDPNAWAFGCGHVLKKEQYDQAMDACNKALAIWPDQPSALMLRGLMLLEGGRLDAAIADFDRLLSRNPSTSAIFALRGIAHFGGGRFEAAIKDFDAALELNRRSSLALYGRGLARQYTGDLAGAAADIAAAELTPKEIERFVFRFGLK